MQKEIYLNLYNNRMLENNEEIEIYEQSLELLSRNFTEEDIVELCSTFEDKTQDVEVMFEAVHLLETLSSETAFKNTIKGIVEMSHSSPEWANIITHRCMNDEFSAKMINQIKNQLDEKICNRFDEILKEIEKEDNLKPSNIEKQKELSSIDENVEKILKKIEENTKTEFIKIKTVISKKPLSLTASKFGGFPYWTDIETYPRAKNGLPLTLLAQINLSDLPQNNIFPDKGLLQFFILNAEDMENYKVVLHKNIDKTVKPLHYIIPTSLMPETIEITADDGTPKVVDNIFWSGFGFPVMGELALEFSKESDSANPSENCFIPEYVKAVKQLGIQLPDDFDIYNLSDETYKRLFLKSECHKLLGHPYFIQDDYRNDENEILLFQMDPAGAYDTSETNNKNNIEFGDAGNAGFFIKKEDLKKLDFSNVFYTWACC